MDELKEKDTLGWYVIKQRLVCQECNGEGYYPVYKNITHRCEACNGTGVFEKTVAIVRDLTELCEFSRGE